MTDLSLEITAVVLAWGTLGYFSKLLSRKFEFSIIRLLGLVFLLLLVIAPAVWLWQDSSEALNEMSAADRWAGLLRSMTVSVIIGLCALIVACQRRSGTIGTVVSKVLRCGLRNRHGEPARAN